MKFTIICVVFFVASIKHAQSSCTQDYETCNYYLNCSENQVIIDGSWQNFIYQEQYSSDSPCPTFVQYGNRRLLPIHVILNNKYPFFHRDDNMRIPEFNDGYMHNIVYQLEIRDHDYSQIYPIIIKMDNLRTLKISRCQLTTAVLSNDEELSELTEIDLSHNNIIDIQVHKYKYVYRQLKKIDLSYNKIVNIADGIFDEFNHLQILNFSNNDIENLSLTTFEGVKTILELNLCKNKLTDINNALFRFTELKTLNLSGNQLKVLRVTDFEKLNKLTNFDLSSNAIMTIDENMFHEMTNLQVLQLNDNQLEVLSNDLFLNLQSLRTIDISKNKLKSLPKGLFQNATIYEFSIAENRLEGSLEKGMFKRVDVTTLDLSHQHLTEIKDYAFYNLSKLNTLLLNSNNIQSLSNMCFKTLTNLEQLDLSQNQITSIDFKKDDLSNLQSLLMKSNRLTEIKHEQLQYLGNLEYLDLSDNQISRLEPKSFQSLRNLINLEINNNPLVGTLKMGTFDGLVLLPSLDISNNMLTIIQNASFKDMNKLTELNMSYCKINELQYDTFNNTGYIETLDLSYNKLKEFHVNTTELGRLSTLLLNNNIIKSISPSSLSDLLRLNKIILSHNLISDLYKASFNNLIHLRHLDLSYNRNLNFSIAMLKNNINLNTLILSGIKTNIKYVNITVKNSITELRVSNASAKNISELQLSAMTHINMLDLSSNNITKIIIGDFTGVNTLKFLDLSFNKISFIQPGAFKDNIILQSLNISHNCLSSIRYGIFRGLMHLSILDMSYNNIKDLKSERFYEVRSLTQLIVDFNRIDSINAEEFEGSSLSKLSIGDNPLPCEILVKLSQTWVPPYRRERIEITAIKLDEHSNENVNGVTCNKGRMREPTVTHTLETVKDDNGILNRLRDILYNLPKVHSETKSNDSQYLDKILNVLEKSSNSLNNEKFTNLANLTVKGIANTNTMLSKIIEILQQAPAVTSITTPLPLTKLFTSTTKQISLDENDPSVYQNGNVIPYINKLKKELENAISVEKQNILKEIYSKFALNNYQTESISKSISNEKLVSNNEGVKSVFTEICVALILLILVGIVLYKVFKRRMFVRNGFSLSTRELPGAMENSAL